MSYFKAKMHQIRFRLGLLLKWRHCFMFGQEKVKCASPCQMWGAGGWSPTHGGGLDAPVSCRCIRLTGDGERGICTAHVHGRWQRWSASQSGIGCHVVQVVTSTVLQTSTVLNDVEMLGLRPAQQTHFRPLTWLILRLCYRVRRTCRPATSGEARTEYSIWTVWWPAVYSMCSCAHCNSK